MISAITGGCLCGKVRFAYAGILGTAAYCHCSDCRRCTGSAFNVSVAMEITRFTIVGALKGFTKKGESGTELTRHFCPDCGSPLYTSSPRHPELIYVKGGALDDPTLLQPAHQSWTRSAVPWAAIKPGLRSFDTGRIEDPHSEAEF
ncbi:MAG: GFA family protein [Nitrospiraceae bacterium]